MFSNIVHVLDPAVSTPAHVPAHEEGCGDLHIIRRDMTEVVVRNVIVDSVGHPGRAGDIICFEFPTSDNILNFTNVSHWYFTYRY